MIESEPGWARSKEVTMRALVVYESMFGNTHAIAQHIAEGIEASAEVTVLAVHDATAEQLAAPDLLVVGGPTHVHGMTSKPSRASAVEMAAKDDDLELDPDAYGEGLRDWFDDLTDDVGTGRFAAAFDTRVHGSTLLTGQASKGIAKRLRSHGFDLVVEGESFFVDKSNHLEPGEIDHATAWGQRLVEAARTAR
ncbi:MAG TPA: flavodoxin domain-containing protein [Ilumatobacteraceae bacterium]|nr:flavodoxin domain-containing protein [Ilumatobacteraceae bacterium]